ncbi:hypothetical protein [Flavobacterium sp. TSSA_36]|uniref:hypothetical protein n=1 Tax=Flavobacterium sp. TSSA_36 TaxID=3447669 RepID=UPI003F3EC1F5
MKTYFVAIVMLAFSLGSHSQAIDKPVQLKQIAVVKTNFRNYKSGEAVHKTYAFESGKLSSITTSDVTQRFFYNAQGLLDHTVKERNGSHWKEVITYKYDTANRLIVFAKKYDENGSQVTKTVTFAYEGSRIKQVTQKSTTQQLFVEEVDYVVENATLVRRSVRDRNQQIIHKTEYFYDKGNLIKQTGLLGDKTIKYFGYDDKASANLLMVKNIFGPHYQVIVPLVSFQEEEFEFTCISGHNELKFSSTANTVVRAGIFKYNAQNYPASYSLIEDSGMIKTVKIYTYE